MGRETILSSKGQKWNFRREKLVQAKKNQGRDNNQSPLTCHVLQTSHSKVLGLKFWPRRLNSTRNTSRRHNGIDMTTTQTQVKFKENSQLLTEARMVRMK